MSSAFTLLFGKFIYHILRIWFRGVVGQSAGTRDERHDASIYAVAERVVVAEDVDIVNATGIVVQQSVNIDDGHAVDEDHGRP